MPQSHLDAASQLDSRLRRFHRLYLGRRALDLLALALAGDLLLDFASFLWSLLGGNRLPIEFFWLVLLPVLAFREVPRLREGDFLLFLDRTFRLKDRLFSFAWFRSAVAVPAFVRRAQAEECLRSVDFAAIERRVRPRFPPLLALSLPLFLGILFLMISQYYVPPGIVGRVGSLLLTPGSRPPAVLPERGILPPPSLPPGRGAKEEGAAKEAGAADGQAREPAAPPRKPTPAETPPAPPGEGVGANGAPQAPPENAVRRPVDLKLSKLKSSPVSPQVAEAVPPRLGEEPSFRSDLFRDPRHLLSLLPWSERDISSRLDTSDLSLWGWDLSRYPIQYRAHISNYYRELMTWKQK